MADGQRAACTASRPRRHRASGLGLAGPNAPIELIGPPQQFLSKLTGFPGSIGIVSSNGGRQQGQPANGARVLVVDDEPNITELLGMALRYEGFTVQTAAPCRAALTAVTQFSPALGSRD